ncbi:MAG TPA: di-heme oxidoredictase family protein [Steroidobacteraceae bacterium]|nr:di-heme oxidoredictase family protein [Steroidobacteraceae bacterium]
MRALAFVAAALLSAVAVAAPVAVPDWWTARLGGDTTMAVSNENAYAFPIPTMPTEDLRKFTFGNRLFNTNWVTAPASVDALDGLGPVFNRVSCSGCHTRDGRGRPPGHDGDALESMLIRLSVPGDGEHGGVRPVPRYGDQLNEKAIAGVAAEGRTVVRYTEQPGTYPDGTHFSLAVPSYSFTDLAFGPLPADVKVSPRVADPVFGLGLLEAVPEGELIAAADPDDANHDGISGRPNRVWDRASQSQRLGRFGWKANQPSLRQQIAAAALGDIGLTTSLFPDQNVAQGQTAAAAAPSGGRPGEPELKEAFLDRLLFYSRTLAVPAARNVDDPRVREGAGEFASIGCASCHAPTLTTGDYPELPELAHQTIHPFTDLLLHDMGAGLADGRADSAANGNEWRTAALWGIGLTGTVNRHTHFLHDGRARSLEEAVLWHGGEAAAARKRFMTLDRTGREALLAFLDNL